MCSVIPFTVQEDDQCKHKIIYSNHIQYKHHRLPMLYYIEILFYSKRTMFQDGFQFRRIYWHLVGFNFFAEEDPLTSRNLFHWICIAAFGPILESQLSWKSSKSLIARWGHEVALFSDRFFSLLLPSLSESQLQWNFFLVQEEIIWRLF